MQLDKFTTINDKLLSLNNLTRINILIHIIYYNTIYQIYQIYQIIYYNIYTYSYYILYLLLFYSFIFI